MKFKTITIVLAFTLMLTGCSCGNHPEHATVYPNNEPTMSETDTGIENEPAIDYMQIYAETLNRYYSLIENGYQDYVGEGEIGVVEITSYDGRDKTLANIGYSIQDISTDCVPELLISTISSGEILAMYTLVEGVPQLSFEGWARNRHYYLGNGKIYNEGSNGAAYTVFGVYTLSADGMTLTCTDFYFTYEKDETLEEIGFYYNTVGKDDKSISQELNISADEFWQIMTDYENQVQPIDTVPFAQYKN